MTATATAAATTMTATAAMTATATATATMTVTATFAARRRALVLTLALVFASGGLAYGAPDNPVDWQDSALLKQELDEIEELIRDLRKFEVAALVHDEKLATAVARSKARPRPDSAPAGFASTSASRQALIARLQAYADTNPTDPELAPRAMLVLAGLYAAQADSSERRATLDNGAAGDADADPYEQNMSQAVALWQRVAETFPDSSHVGDALVPLAREYYEQGQYEQAKQAYQRIVCKNREGELDAVQEARDWADDALAEQIYTNSVRVTDYRGCVSLALESQLVDAAWMRLGRLHRNTYGEQALAISAFSQVTRNVDSDEYINALEELASAYVDTEQLIEAIPALDDLVIHIDRHNLGDPLSRDMRARAVQRVSRIVALLWRQSAIPAPDSARKLCSIYYHRGRKHQGHVREIFDALGDALREYGAFDQVVPVWRHTLDVWPLHPDAPLVHDKLIKLLVAKGDASRADIERALLVRNHGKGSRWHRANASFSNNIARSSRVVERNLYELALSQYRQATLSFDRLRRQNKRYGATKRSMSEQSLFDEARGSIERFVADYPTSRRAYEMRYLLARVDYYGGRWLDAAREFARLRERGRDKPFFEEATRLMMSAFNEVLTHDTQSGAVVLPKLPTATELSAGAPARAPSPPAYYEELLRAHDGYADVVASVNEAARVALDAAELELRFRRLDGAQTRLEAVAVDYCQICPPKVSFEIPMPGNMLESRIKGVSRSKQSSLSNSTPTIWLIHSFSSEVLRISIYCGNTLSVEVGKGHEGYASCDQRAS